MKNLKSENGAITIIVLVSLLLFTTFLISTYMLVSNKIKSQKEVIEETRRIYETETQEEAYNSFFSNVKSIPIYTKEHYLSIATGDKILINQKYFTFTENSSYILMNDLEIKEDDLPQDWIGVPEEFFDTDENEGSINYNEHIVTINYNDGTEKIYNGKVFQKYTSIFYLDENDVEQEFRTNDATINATTYSNDIQNKTKITRVIFGRNCTQIATDAFNGCTNLVEIITSDINNITIGYHAFMDCTNLERIEFPNVTFSTTNNGIQFKNCTKLNEVVLGSQGHPITNIPIAFHSCTQNNLAIKVYIADGETSLAGAPWGATNATIEYYNASTGEKIN